VVVRKLPEPWAAICMPDRRKIVLSPSGYGPRDEQSIAHELIELHVGRLSECDHEAFCQRGGAALLLPRQQFMASALEAGFQVPALRRKWRFASWEVIARRISDLFEGITSAAWCNGQPRWRSPCGDPSEAELAAVRGAVSRGRCEVKIRGVLTTAWRLVDKRVDYRAISLSRPL